MSSIPSPQPAKTGKGLPANRTAALAAFIVGLAGCATSLAGVYPNSATNEIALILGGTATIAGPISHVIGSWFWDKRTTDLQIAQMQLEQDRLYHSNFNRNTEAETPDNQESNEPGYSLPNKGSVDIPVTPTPHPTPIVNEGPIPYPNKTPEDFPSSDTEDESGSATADPNGSSSETSIDLGQLDESHNPDHSLAPESESPTESSAEPIPETGPEIQKTNGGEA